MSTPTKKTVPLNLWGEPLEDEPLLSIQIEDTSNAVHGNPSHHPNQRGGLEDDEMQITTVSTPSGEQQMLVVSEPGVYSLIFKSRKPEAKRFKRWLAHEVLPSIRRTGSYSLPRQDRASQEAKRLKCDPETAKARVDQFKLNKTLARRMISEGACPNDIKRFHNAAYRGQT